MHYIFSITNYLTQNIKEYKMSEFNKVLNYGLWLLWECHYDLCEEEDFFDYNEDGFKKHPWSFKTICHKDLGWTGNINFAFDAEPSRVDREYNTRSQAEAFDAIMTSLYCADAHQDLRRHVEDDVLSDQEDAIQDIRLFVDKALALSLKYGPFNDAEIKTLEFRMDFLRTLISYHKGRINPSLM